MNIEETTFDLSEYEPISRELFRRKPDCPQMDLSSDGIFFDSHTRKYFEGTEYAYFFCLNAKFCVI